VLLFVPMVLEKFIKLSNIVLGGLSALGESVTVVKKTTEVGC